VKKEVLKLADKNFQEDVLLYAISSSESDIRICQIINRILKINLALTESLEITKKNSVHHFRRYVFESEEEIEKFLLIVNRSEGNYLFPEIEKIDFILVIITESPKEPFDTDIQKLKLLPEIAAIYKVDQFTLKSFNKLTL
jgi:hypothetical protein